MTIDISVFKDKTTEYWHNGCDIYNIHSKLTVAVNKKRGTVVYVGEWDPKTNLPHGYGKQYKAIGRCERDGSYEIDGTGTFPCGKISYKGEWKMGNKDGFGYNWRLDGYMYKGTWSNNLYHGYGTLFCSDKEIEQKGTWREGRIINGIGKKKLKNGTYFLGEISNGFITSNGAYYHNNNEPIKFE